MSERRLAGSYPADLQWAVLTQAQTGTPQFECCFVLSDGAQVRVFLPVTSSAAQYTAEKLERMGWNKSTSDPQFSVKRQTLTLKYADYDGESREKWDIGFGPPARAPQAVCDNVGAMLGAVPHDDNADGSQFRRPSAASAGGAR